MGSSEKALSSPKPTAETDSQSFGKYAVFRVSSYLFHEKSFQYSFFVSQLLSIIVSVLLVSFFLKSWVLFESIGGLIILGLLVGLAFWLSYLFSRRYERTLDEITRSVREAVVERSELQVQFSIGPEFTPLLSELNNAAYQLQRFFSKTRDERNRLHAILENMSDGVIAIDRKDKILAMNAAARGFFRIEGEDIRGKHRGDVFVSSELDSFVDAIRKSGELLETEFSLSKNDLHFRVTGRPLKDYHKEGFGVVIVLNEVTKVRKLELIRKDFVANVSHELRTPITSIKGFIETLLSGAKDDPDDCQRFLEIVSVHSERLSAIIDDLLSLSRIEHAGNEIEKDDTDLSKLILRTVELSESKAQQRRISLNISSLPRLIVPVKAHLVEQALLNLVENAVKYTEENTTVSISLRKVDNWAVIAVKDQGKGIPPEHLPRLFERFYRVDKARSRALGGTGLGLALVKHICQAHGGFPKVESVIGEGSTFSMWFACGDKGEEQSS